VDDKERQLEILRLREASLVEECQRHQQTIRQLMENRDASPQGYILLLFMQMWPLREDTTSVIMSVCLLCIYSYMLINI